MKTYTHTSPYQRDRETRQKQRDALTRADIERAEQRVINDASIDSNASKWRYSRPDGQMNGANAIGAVRYAGLSSAWPRDVRKQQCLDRRGKLARAG